MLLLTLPDADPAYNLPHSTEQSTPSARDDARKLEGELSAISLTKHADLIQLQQASANHPFICAWGRLVETWASTADKVKSVDSFSKQDITVIQLRLAPMCSSRIIIPAKRYPSLFR